MAPHRQLRVLVLASTRSALSNTDVIGDFGEKALFYTGNAMGVHRHLSRREALTPALIDRWLTLWDQTVGHGHQGVTATQAKSDAARIALATKRNLNRPARSGAPPTEARLRVCPGHRPTTSPGRNS